MSIDSVKFPLIFDDDSRMQATKMTNYTHVTDWNMLCKLLKIKRHDNLLIDTYDKKTLNFMNAKIVSELILIGNSVQIFRFKELSDKGTDDSSVKDSASLKSAIHETDENNRITTFVYTAIVL